MGIHLILLYSKSDGKAVDQQVRDNSNFTICLKVKTADTSKSLVGIPDAIQLRRGKAYFHVEGPQKFKVAYTADNYSPPDLGLTVVEEKRNTTENRNISENLLVRPRPLLKKSVIRLHNRKFHGLLPYGLILSPKILR